MLTDKKVQSVFVDSYSVTIELIFQVAALDQSLSELNLIDIMSQQTSSEIVWKTINDFQKDPYTTGLSIFSKITDKILFSPNGREYRPEEEMAELLQVKKKKFLIEMLKFYPILIRVQFWIFIRQELLNLFLISIN